MTVLTRAVVCHDHDAVEAGLRQEPALMRVAENGRVSPGGGKWPREPFSRDKSNVDLTPGYRLHVANVMRQAGVQSQNQLRPLAHAA